MATPMRKDVVSPTSSNGGGQHFPPESYLYEGDVTPEAVEILRKKASKAIDAQEWEVVDGFEYSA